jgi:FixJ family two-component response regulator
MSPAVQLTEGVSAYAGHKILIVDDSQAVTRALSKLLSGRGMKPIPCLSATEAIAQADQFNPAAAVIDIHLPDLSGLILSQQLRARFGEMPIIVVSGDGSREVLSSLAHVGVTYFFSKPVNAQALVEKLEGLLPKV